ncbi:glycosyltransferase family 87 protein [Archangium lipolyticum]|uniref:glycosyltransferase family 87 protein n=1 Tax=Archangium lipolyticum TaxID=2970465 RepID=UPI002149A0BF|nr:glycosyltransferase family 87 protein [Archangium lipolyticum]
MTHAGERKPLAAWVVVSIGVFALALHAVVFQVQADWAVFYKAGANALAGQPLYRYEDLPWVYKYAPVTAYLFAPFAALPETVARWSWVLLNAAVLVRAFHVWASMMPRTLPRWAHALVVVLALPFIKQVFLYGNCDTLLLWLALESEALRGARPIASGALLAVACLFKPPLALLALVAVFSREWRRVAAVGVFGLALLLLPVFFLGPSFAWSEILAWRKMLEDSTGPLICANQNQGVFGIACWFLSPADGARYTLLAAGLGLALATVLSALLAALARTDAALGRLAVTAVAVYCTAVLSPLGWRNNLVMLVPLLFLLLDAALLLRSRATFAWALAAPGLGTLMGLLAYEILGRARFQHFLELRPFGLCAAVTAVTALVLQLRVARKGFVKAPAEQH